ncbi:MAG: hypothetical protein J6X44_05720, partial [Thermoguttaceae bacterium]|nr:hypothetical protein [Thermoguttaceae bacterium]
SGEIDECVFANNGLGCVDVEDTPGDRWVEIRNSRLVKSGFASLSLHNRGRARVVDSELVAHVTSCAEVNEDSTLEARSVRFRGLVPFDPTDEKAPDPAGIATANSTVRVVDSSFEDLVVGIYFHSSKVELERCRITAGRYSVLSPDADDNFAMKDCRLFREPILNMDRNPEYGQPDSDADDEDFDDDFGVSDAELDADFNDETGDNSDAGRDADDDEEFDDDDWERAYEIKSKKIEELLGRGAPIVNHAVIPYAVGGMFDGYFYPNSRYGGTFVVSQELVNPRFNAPGNSSFHSFELAMATRQKCPSRYTNEDDSSDDEEEADPLEKKFNIRLPFLKKALSNESEEERFVKTANVYMRIMTFIGRYVESYKTINRYETLEFPHDFDDEELAGRCFVFDALGTPYSNNKSATDLLASFDRDVYAFPGENKDEKTERDPDEPGTFGLLLIIELNRSEMNQARKEGGKNFIERLKQENVWPFSDLNRKKIK